MKIVHASILLALAMFTAQLSANHGLKSKVDTELTKTKEGLWVLTYRTGDKVKRIGFRRNPSDMRTKRWFAISPDFEVVVDNGKEYIQRIDGGAFKNVSLRLTATYAHIGKDYAPISPYSDGGALVHSGRLFACDDVCNDAVNKWPITVTVPENEFVIVNGQVYKDRVSWVDQNSGANIYIGAQKPTEEERFVSVIDKALPNKLKTAINQQIPALMQYFEQKLGKVNGVKPMLYASYSNKPGQDSQGGTFLSQIFMHWDMDNLEKRVQNEHFFNNTLWFFSHEVAHFYQRTQQNEKLYGDYQHAWLHEGGAEYFASLAVTDLFKEQQSFVALNTDKHLKHCINGLAKTSLLEAAKSGQHKLYYSCGFLIHRMIDEETKQISNGQYTIFDVWLRFRELVEQGNKVGTDTFWLAVSSFVSKDAINQLKKLTTEKIDSPDTYMQTMLNRI